MKYSIEEGSVNLLKITNKINCSKCGNTLMVVNEDVIFSRSVATLIDFDNKKLLLKCIKCKSFNTIDLKDINKKEIKTLLEI